MFRKCYNLSFSFIILHFKKVTISGKVDQDLSRSALCEPLKSYMQIKGYKKAQIWRYAILDLTSNDILNFS